MKLIYSTKIRIDKTKGNLLMVGKDNPLPKDYRPPDMITPHVAFADNDNFVKTLLRKEAAHAIEHLFDSAYKCNLKLYGISFFRPYFRQQAIYNSAVATKGEQYASLYISQPGASEHQSGLSADVSSQSAGLALTPSFAHLPEGIWLSQNAHKYGFILRYPLGKEGITGYAFEPWHIRYVGKCAAKNIYRNNLCFEEWYEINKKYFS